MEDKYLKELEIEPMEILDDTPIEKVLDYYFRLLVNNNIKKMNNKISQKITKGSIKDANLETANFTEAVKQHLFDKENKKLLDGEMIEEYRTKLENGSDEFNGLDGEWETILKEEDELKEAGSSIEDKIKETGADVKALQNIVKQFVEDLNPNKKPPKDNLVLEGTIESYNKMLRETKILVFKESKDIK